MRKLLCVVLCVLPTLLSGCGEHEKSTSEVQGEIAGNVSCNGSGGAKGLIEGRVSDSRDQFFIAFNRSCSDWKNHKVPPNKLGEHYYTDFKTRVRFVVSALNTSKSSFTLKEQDCLSIGRRLIDGCDTNTTRAKWGGKFKNGNSEWSIKSYTCPLQGCRQLDNVWNPW